MPGNPADGPLDPPPPHCQVVKTSGAVVIDGALDEAAWANAPAVELGQINLLAGHQPCTRYAARFDVYETAKVRFLYDDKYLYVGWEAVDRDIIAHTREDQAMLCNDCDTLELFIKQGNANCYWELYVNPWGSKSTFFMPSGGCRTSDIFAKDKLMNGYHTAAMVQGTINDQSDSDIGWTAEMAVPLSEFAKRGVTFTPGTPWTILLGRYNYSKDFRVWQLSSYPCLPIPNFHLLEGYAPVDWQ
jgi:hypothetical protein